MFLIKPNYVPSKNELYAKRLISKNILGLFLFVGFACGFEILFSLCMLNMSKTDMEIHGATRICGYKTIIIST
ncbi:hypothetical protein ACJX0J_014202, partial [Zea mays]